MFGKKEENNEELELVQVEKEDLDLLITMFDLIRTDWRDPRNECRIGVKTLKKYGAEVIPLQEEEIPWQD